MNIALCCSFIIPRTVSSIPSASTCSAYDCLHALEDAAAIHEEVRDDVRVADARVFRLDVEHPVLVPDVVVVAEQRRLELGHRGEPTTTLPRALSARADDPLEARFPGTRGPAHLCSNFGPRKLRDAQGASAPSRWCVRAGAAAPRRSCARFITSSARSVGADTITGVGASPKSAAATGAAPARPRGA